MKTRILITVIFSLAYMLSFAQPNNEVIINDVKIKTTMSAHNSAGGRHFEFDIINLSSKTIKYITIRHIAFDNFFAPACCSIDNNSICSTKTTGPIEGHPELLSVKKIPNRYIISRQTIDLHYNTAATQSRLLKCTIEFTDDTVIEYTNNELFDYMFDRTYKMYIKEFPESQYSDDTINYIKQILLDKYFY